MEQFPGMSDGNININDVIEVIETEMNAGQAGQAMPYVEITEQPASKALRFRYECEGRSAGSIPGVNSTPENKTFPSIRIAGYKGRALVVVSCVTKDPPHRPHPHNLVGKDACKRGVCTVEVTSENMTVTFANLGIQCVKKKDIEEALRIREEIRVDPFKTGFEHKRQPTSIDLNAVRLCFQVFVQGTQKGKFNVALPAVVSDPIFDKKAMSDLVISKLSHCSASVAGGMEMILLCEKVAKEDIHVRFFEEKDGKVVWEGFGDFQPAHVHKQTAIAFRTPTYRIQQVDQPVQVYIQLKRPSDGATSEPLPFQMLPLGADDPDSLRRKRQKINNSQYAVALRQMQAEGEKRADMLIPPSFNIIKPEPIDRKPVYGIPGGSGESFPFYPVKTPPQDYCAMQALRPPVPPQGRTLSPVEYTSFNPPVIQAQLPEQYPATNSRVAPPFAYVPDESQVQLQEQLMMDGVPTSYPVLELDAAAGIVDGIDATSVLDMDSQQQFNFETSFNELNSAELAAISTALSENLSGGLSISETQKPGATRATSQEASNGDSNSMMDSFTRLTAELSTLNSMYRPRREVDD